MATTQQDYDTLQSDVHHRAHVQDGLLSTAEKQEEDWEERRCSSMSRGVVAWKGFVLVLFSCLCHAANSMAIKLLTGSVSALEIAAFRQFSAVIYLSPPLLFKNISMRIERKHVPFIGLWIIASTAATCFSYYALVYISAGDAIAIMFSSPIFTGIMAWIFLREKLTLLDALFLSLTIVGIVLIARPSFIFVGLQVPQHSNVVLGVIAALTSTVSISASTVVMRKLGKTNIHPFSLLVILGVTGTLLVSIVASILNVWKIPQCGFERIILIISGILAIAGHVPILYAIKVEKAVNVAMFRTNMVIFTIIFEFAIFGTTPFYLSLIGTGLIIFSSLGTTIKKWNTANRRKRRLDERNGQSENENSDLDNSIEETEDN